MFLEFEHSKMDMDEVDLEGYTPLFLMASIGEPLKLRRLLELSADLKYQSWADKVRYFMRQQSPSRIGH